MDDPTMDVFRDAALTETGPETETGPTREVYRLTSSRAPYVRGGISFSTTRGPVDVAVKELSDDQLSRLSADVAIRIERVTLTAAPASERGADTIEVEPFIPNPVDPSAVALGVGIRRAPADIAAATALQAAADYATADPLIAGGLRPRATLSVGAPDAIAERAPAARTDVDASAVFTAAGAVRPDIAPIPATEAETAEVTVTVNAPAEVSAAPAIVTPASPVPIVEPVIEPVVGAEVAAPVVEPALDPVTGQELADDKPAKSGRGKANG